MASKKQIINKRNSVHTNQLHKSSSLATDLAAVIEDFGSKQFQIRNSLLVDVNEKFGRKGIKEASSLKQELENNNVVTSSALKEYVTDNYHRFIETSKEIVHIESDMLNLNSMLNEYRSVLKSLQSSKAQFDCQAVGEINTNKTQTESKQVSDDAQALKELSEELGGLLYERKFEQVVSIIETAYDKMDELDANAVRVARSQVDRKVEQLVDMLSVELQSATLKSSERRRYTQYLIRLGHPDKALQIFLQNRSVVIKTDIRKIKFQGDLSVYISELSTVVTTAIAATCVDFRKLFVDRDMMSGFVVWAVSELDSFGVIFQRQVFHNDTPISKIGECLKLAFTASKTSLDQSGLKIGFVLASRFAPHLAETIDKEYLMVEHELEAAILQENWVATELWVRVSKPQNKTKTKPGMQQRAVKLTDSAKLLYDIIHRLITNLKFLLNNQLYPQTSAELYVPIVQGIIRLFEKYLLKMTEASRNLTPEGALLSKTEEDAQQLAIVANTFYLADDLLPRVSRQYEKQFERPVPELEQFQHKLTRLYRALREQYCQRRASVWIAQVFHWDAVFRQRYTLAEINEDIMVASPTFECFRFIKFLCHLRDLILFMLNADAVGPLIAKSLEEVFLQLAGEESYWIQCQFGQGGLKQFVLDVKAIMKAGENYITENVEEAAEKLIQKATECYCESKKIDISKVYLNPVWFVSVVDAKVQDNIAAFTIPDEITE